MDGEGFIISYSGGLTTPTFLGGSRLWDGWSDFVVGPNSPSARRRLSAVHQFHIYSTLPVFQDGGQNSWVGFSTFGKFIMRLFSRNVGIAFSPRHINNCLSSLRVPAFGQGPTALLCICWKGSSYRRRMRSLLAAGRKRRERLCFILFYLFSINNVITLYIYIYILAGWRPVRLDNDALTSRGQTELPADSGIAEA
ncbi:hypothetical protein N657DRAFT_291948 [Parathielavia appendiculata]|uniref:Uncharacterized protein n=1 Tax=Parathielavia appendiculata TaxID=2587402 RepID=A0AAN6Z682_9PEZI|nr:hypothetical protein N657DRAFT_291948 [Parathielavia appendiculata]